MSNGNHYYIYKGLLSRIKEIPTPEEREKCASITFYPEDLMKWSIEDDPGEEEWKGIPVKRAIEELEGEKVLRWTGDFSGLRRLNFLKDMEKPSFWVPLSTRTNTVPHFPISQNKYSIVEFSYRMQYGKCVPAWTWHYTTGQFFEYLDMDFKWTTVARAWCFNSFPRKMDNFALRLYSFTRTKETMYVRSIRFREPTEKEKNFLNKKDILQLSNEKPIHYTLLDNFFPIGVYINANTARNMSHLFKTDLASYLDLLFEDISLHYHNVAFVEKFYDFLPGDQEVLFETSKKYNVKLIISLEEENILLDPSKATSYFKEKEHTIKRYATEDNLFGWVIKENPSDVEADTYIQIKKKIEQIDEKHPVIYLTREANAFPLYTQFSSVAGLSHWKSKNPWELGQVIKTHMKFINEQHLWVIGPTFVFGSGAPIWNSAPEIRLMINLAISSGARGWLSYTYHNTPLWSGGECQRSLTGPFLTFSDVWQELGGRLGRFYSLASLVMSAKPSSAPDFRPDIQSRKHPRSRCPGNVDILMNTWMKGDNFWLLYIVNQDTSEVTGVNINFHSALPEQYRVYDATQFVRSYQWEELPPSLHREMFPGQGQIMLIATPEECQRWGEIIMGRIFNYIEQQIFIDIELLKPYLSSIDKIADKVRELGEKRSINALHKMVEIKNQVTNTIYSTEDLYKVRGKLFEVGAILCACDGVLCRLLSESKNSIVEKYKEEILQLAGEFIECRMGVREGKGKKFLAPIGKLSERLSIILQELRQNAST